MILTTTTTTAAVAWAPMARSTSTVASGRSRDLPSNESNKGRGDSMQVHPCHLTFSARPVRALLVEAWLIMCKNSRENLYLLIVGNALFIQGFGAPPERRPFTIGACGARRHPHDRSRPYDALDTRDDS